MVNTDRLIRHYIERAESTESQAEEKENEIRRELVLDSGESEDIQTRLITSLDDDLIDALYSERNNYLKQAIDARAEALEHQKQSENHNEALRNIRKLVNDYQLIASVPYAVQSGEDISSKRFHLDPIENRELLGLETEEAHLIQDIREITGPKISSIEAFAIAAMDFFQSDNFWFQMEEVSIGTADEEFANTLADKIVEQVNDELADNEDNEESVREFLRALLIQLLATAIITGSIEIAKVADDQRGSSEGSVGGGDEPITEIDESTLIDEPGVYILTSDITSAEGPIIRIEADHVTLNGNGHTLTSDFSSPGWSQSGIEATNVENINIRNIHITKFGKGIYITNAKKCCVEWVTATQCRSCGIAIQTSDSTVQENTLRNINEGVGISVKGSNNTVAENDIRYLDMGLRLGGHNTTVRNNTIDSTEEGIVISGNNQTLTNNIVKDSAIWGIHIVGSVNNKIMRNHFHNAAITGDTENSIIIFNDIDID